MFADGPIVVGGGGSDLRLFHEYGIPAVLYGPGGDNAHGVDEYVEIDQLTDFCLILANLLCQS
jgi:acetylornithine deacetylase/succinyl-diaminopimelate desuccinylase-like protein